MKVRIQKVVPDVKTPSYANPGDAGFDLYAAEETIISPGQRMLVRSGIKMAVPEGYVGLIWDKSGRAAKDGLKTMAGVLDSGYRGEILIVMHNLSDKEVKIEKNHKVAQMLIQPIHKAEFEEVESLDDTQRGEGGFGSSGLR